MFLFVCAKYVIILTMKIERPGKNTKIAATNNNES